MIVLYILVLFALSGYSYSLVDPNLTLFSSPVWITIREWAVTLGYYHRDWSWYIYVGIILLMSAFHLYFVRHESRYKPLTLAFVAVAALYTAYPFLSHDFFNYLFDAKILTFYHENPYVMKALDFPYDPWIRFMHWTHRSYPYGPFFLVLTLVPSFLSGAKFIVDYLLFKLLFAVFYLIAVIFLTRIKKIYGLFFATHPVVLLEGLVNSHNDLIAVAFGTVGVYYLVKKGRPYLGTLFMILSLGIKYLTFPFLLLSKKDKRRNYLALAGFGGILLYTIFFKELQPWYFLNLFILLPFFEVLMLESWIFSVGLMLSYYSFVRLGEWTMVGDTPLKYFIILVFLVLNIVYLKVRGTMVKQRL